MDAGPVVETATLARLLLHICAAPPTERILVEENVDVGGVAAFDAGRVGGRQTANCEREQRQHRDEEQHLGCSAGGAVDCCQNVMQEVRMRRGAAMVSRARSVERGGYGVKKEGGKILSCGACQGGKGEEEGTERKTFEAGRDEESAEW